MREVIIPTVEGMSLEGNPYTGFLYAGLMITADGTPMVLEYNCRFGDPETQPIILRLKSDLVHLCDAALDKKLDQVEITWDKRAALGVVMAAGGYPLQYKKGDVISGLPDDGNRRNEGLSCGHHHEGRPCGNKRREGPVCHSPRRFGPGSQSQSLRDGRKASNGKMSITERTSVTAPLPGNPVVNSFLFSRKLLVLSC